MLERARVNHAIAEVNLAAFCQPVGNLNPLKKTSKSSISLSPRSYISNLFNLQLVILINLKITIITIAIIIQLKKENKIIIIVIVISITPARKLKHLKHQHHNSNLFEFDKYNHHHHCFQYCKYLFFHQIFTDQCTMWLSTKVGISKVLKVKA